MKLLYTDPKKRRLQQIELVLFLLLSPGIYFGYLSAKEWQRFSEAQTLQTAASQELHAGNLDGALNKLQKASELYPDSPGIWEDLAVTYYLRKDHENAIQTYVKALEYHPDHGDFHRNLAMAYHNVGKHDRELEHAEIANKMVTSDELFTLRIAERARWEANGKKGRIAGTQPISPGQPDALVEDTGHHDHDHDHEHSHDHDH